MDSDASVSGNEKSKGLAWLRSVLESVLQVSPLSYRQKRRTRSCLKRMPDWFLACCADALNIDYLGGSSCYTNMAELARTDAGRSIAQQYLETHDAVTTGNCIEQLTKSVLRQSNGDQMSGAPEIIKRQVVALALATCSEEGARFNRNARDILREEDSDNRPIVDYQMALEYGDTSKIEALETVLTSSQYGNWVANRISEINRWLNGETDLKIQWEISALPDNDDIYQYILKGGKRNEG